MNESLLSFYSYSCWSDLHSSKPYYWYWHDTVMSVILLGFCREIDMTIIISVFSRIFIYCISQFQLLPSVIVTRIVSCEEEKRRTTADGMWNILSCYGLRRTLKKFCKWNTLILRLNQVVYNKLEVISKLPINPLWEDLQWTSREWANCLAHIWWSSEV